jgi:hypothetical protein
MAGRKFDFTAGHSFLTQEWFSPDEPSTKSSLIGQPNDQWRFGANTATDLPLVFVANDVKEVVIPDDLETIKVFTGAPFKVTVQNRLPKE